MASDAGVRKGPIVKTGWLYKQGGSIKTWKNRYFILTTHSIIYQEAENSETPKGTIDINDVQGVLDSGSKESYWFFSLVTEARTYLIRSSDPDKKRRWMRKIEWVKAHRKKKDQEKAKGEGRAKPKSKKPLAKPVERKTVVRKDPKARPKHKTRVLPPKPQQVPPKPQQAPLRARGQPRKHYPIPPHQMAIMQQHMMSGNYGMMNPQQLAMMQRMMSQQQLQMQQDAMRRHAAAQHMRMRQPQPTTTEWDTLPMHSSSPSERLDEDVDDFATQVAWIDPKGHDVDDEEEWIGDEELHSGTYDGLF